MPATRERATIDAINALGRAAFVDRLGGLFEGSPWIADAAWSARPWANASELHRSLVAVVSGATDAQRLALIRAHPDLVGRAALAGTLTPESTAEQRAAGLDPGALSADEVARFAAANAAYRSRFGVPFVICARENTKATILAALNTRLTHDAATEVQVAITEIAKIAWLRLGEVVATADPGDMPAPGIDDRPGEAAR